MKYHRVQDGDLLTIKMNRNNKIACCDCGLVHNFHFYRLKGRVVARVVRNRRATAAVRRHLTVDVNK